MKLLVTELKWWDAAEKSWSFQVNQDDESKQTQNDMKEM